MAAGAREHKLVRLWVMKSSEDGHVYASYGYKSLVEDVDGAQHKYRGDDGRVDLGLPADARTKTLAQVLQAVKDAFKADFNVPQSDTVGQDLEEEGG